MYLSNHWKNYLSNNKSNEIALHLKLLTDLLKISHTLKNKNPDLYQNIITLLNCPMAVRWSESTPNRNNVYHSSQQMTTIGLKRPAKWQFRCQIRDAINRLRYFIPNWMIDLSLFVWHNLMPISCTFHILFSFFLFFRWLLLLEAKQIFTFLSA